MADDREEQFEKLYKYYPAVVKLLLNLGFELEDARDLAQQVFVRVYEHMDTYRGESKWAYLQQVTRRLAYNENRDRHAGKRHGTTIPTEEILELEDTHVPQPEAVLQSKEDTERVQHAIGQLSPKDQTSIRLQLAGYSLEEIAAVIGTTALALKSRLNGVRKRLRQLLGDDVEGLGGNDDQ
jgi:RNA polymerase sigma-70 factor (ECF subfamily)